MADLKDFAEQLVNLTVKEVNELADILKEEYGIEPAAAAGPVMVAGGAGGDAAGGGGEGGEGELCSTTITTLCASAYVSGVGGCGGADSSVSEVDGHGGVEGSACVASACASFS